MTAMRWILGIVGLLVANVIAMVILAVTANTDGAQVIPAYYETALKYDDVIDEAARSRALGWRVDASIAGGALEIAVRDATGAPIRDARVHVVGYQRTRANSPFDLALVGDATGYRVAMPATGWYDITIVVERGGDRFTRKISIEAR